jgi:hypothetical protein
MISPNHQFEVTSLSIEGGRQIRITRKSPTAKLTMKIFVIVRMWAFFATTSTTNELPSMPMTNMMKANMSRNHSKTVGEKEARNICMRVLDEFEEPLKLRLARMSSAKTTDDSFIVDAGAFTLPRTIYIYITNLLYLLCQQRKKRNSFLYYDICILF